MYVHLDVTQEQSWADFYRTAEGAFGPVSILVNNAGARARCAPRADTHVYMWKRIIAVNQTGVFRGCGRWYPPA